MKKIIKLIFSVVLIIPFSVYANTVINGNDFEIYNRSKADIYNKWDDGKIDDSVDVFVSNPQYEAPYKAGVVTDEYLKEVLDNLNYYRYLVGVPEISESTSNDNELQTAEVIQTIYVLQEQALTHYLYEDFTKPSDMDDDFWNIGAYARHNIISYGRPDEPIFYFFDESIFDKSYPMSGHRMALLSADVKHEDFGIGNLTIYGRSILDLANYDKMNNSFAAYPSPGLFPKQDFADISDWDIFLNVKDFKYLNSDERKNVKVTITDLNTNEVYERSIGDGNLVFDTKNYGYCNTNNGYGACEFYSIKMNILQPPKENDYYDGNYKVYVSNLKNSNNELVDIEYTVNFYDKMEGTTSKVVSVKPFIDNIYYDDEYDEDFFNQALEDVFIELTLDNGNTYNYMPSEYKINYYGTAGYGTSVYHAYPVVDNLPDYIKDDDNLIKNKYIVIQCNTIPSTYKMTYGDISYIKNIGSNVEMGIDGIRYGFNGYGIYTWLHEKDDVYEEITNSDKFLMSDNDMKSFSLTINNIDREDKGNYRFMLVLFDSEKRYYYISKDITLDLNIPFDSINVENDEIEMRIGNKLKVNIETSPVDATGTITWSSSDDSILSVDNEGNVVAKKRGSVVITITDGNIVTNVDVNITGYILGDMNKNDKIDLPDIILLLKYYLGIEEISEEDSYLADINEDNKIGLQDVIMLLKKYLGVD